MSNRDIVVVGASAGGVEALIDFVRSLPLGYDGSVFIVLHTAPYSPGYLANILNKDSALEAVYPRDGDKIKKGKIYVAPPDHHLIIENDTVLVRKGPKENRFRPSVDALFRSAAYSYGSAVVGIVLSGLLDDGTSGLWTIKRLGGFAITQKDAMYDSMPNSASAYVDIDYCVNAGDIGMLLSRLATEEAPTTNLLTESEMEMLKAEVVIAGHDHAFEMGIIQMGDLTAFTCPECSGALVSFKEGKIVRFRCHTGHAFTASSLLTGVTEQVENQLWKTMRGLEETTMLMEKIGQKFEEVGDPEMAKKFFKKGKESKKRSHILYDLITTQENVSEDERFKNEETPKLQKELIL